MRKILIGGAWPYANGSLHIGHIAGLLPGDVIARYHRALGDEVYFVSGSDCHGTPVAIRAKQENKTPREISDHYHEEFTDCFKRLGFSYDCYTKTSSPEHIDFVQRFHKKLYESEYVYEKESPQAYCAGCDTFLADRFVTGICPKCGAPARGDQCDVCGTVLEPESLKKPICAVCGKPIEFRNSKHLYIAISKLEKKLKALVDEHTEWRKNAIAFTNKYIEEGLRDRALTRDLEWGIPVPKKGYENKTIYIWAENVLGYLSASEAVVRQTHKTGTIATAGQGDTENANACQNSGALVDADREYRELWDPAKVENIHYYVHGKDNIPFHTIILPSLLLANGEGWSLPDRIISSEYLTLEGRKISTSRNYAIWVSELLDRFDPDSIRYYFLANGPEKRDADFSWENYVNSHNGELLGAYGNLVNRTLAFIAKYYDGVVPEGASTLSVDAQSPSNVATRHGRDNNRGSAVQSCTEGITTAGILARIDDLFVSAGRKIESGDFRDCLTEIFDLVRFANKYFDTEQPWITRTFDPAKCKNTLFHCVQIIANLAVLLSPFLPFSSEKVCRWLGLSTAWKTQSVPAGYVLPEISILFERIDKKVIAEESDKLKALLP
ncbi:MAG: methionine--tRNA ligase [Lachnospiraceae bacterium]|nr:methionine--tRNA ligase [Lachnospiraceae bacterium]